MESLHILPYAIGSQAINERLKYSAVKRSGAMLASGQAAKMAAKIPVAALTTASVGVSPSLVPRPFLGGTGGGEGEGMVW